MASYNGFSLVGFNAAINGVADAVDVRFGSLADMATSPRDVRFILESGHSAVPPQCPLCANSEYSAGTSIEGSANATPLAIDE